LAELPGQDVLIAAAAVADYMPEHTAPQKIKKTGETLTLVLVRTPDILAEIARSADRPRCVVGFAAETGDLERYALGKLREKSLDLIAANDVSLPGIGFEGDENELAVFSAEGRRDIPRGSKEQVAEALLDLVDDWLERSP
jgi:phosphopantothenoylcysteine decarboxylase/phosphopantothenate--cysteine ligase